MRALVPLTALLFSTPAFAHLSRPTNREPEPLQYDLEDNVLSFTSGSFLVHYVVDGRNGVGREDLDRDAIVDRVERVAEAYARALATFTSTLGFAPPPSDGDDWIDVYLLDTGPIPGGRLIESCPADRPTSCWSFIIHPISSSDDELLAKRALFRAILSGYRTYYDSPLEAGTTAWVVGDDGFTDAYLRATKRSLGDAKIAEDGGTALFLSHLSDVELVRGLWEDIAASYTNPDWRKLLDARLTDRGTSLAIEFKRFAEANADRVEVDPVEDVLPFPPLSARYFAADEEIEGDGLEQSVVGDVLVAVNATLETIEARPAGCACVLDPREGPPVALPFAGMLLAQRRRRTRRSAETSSAANNPPVPCAAASQAQPPAPAPGSSVSSPSGA